MINQPEILNFDNVTGPWHVCGCPRPWGTRWWRGRGDSKEISRKPTHSPPPTLCIVAVATGCPWEPGGGIWGFSLCCVFGPKPRPPARVSLQNMWAPGCSARFNVYWAQTGVHRPARTVPAPGTSQARLCLWGPPGGACLKLPPHCLPVATPPPPHLRLLSSLQPSFSVQLSPRLWVCSQNSKVSIFAPR